MEPLDRILTLRKQGDHRHQATSQRRNPGEKAGPGGTGAGGFPIPQLKLPVLTLRAPRPAPLRETRHPWCVPNLWPQPVLAAPDPSAQLACRGATSTQPTPTLTRPGQANQQNPLVGAASPGQRCSVHTGPRVLCGRCPDYALGTWHTQLTRTPSRRRQACASLAWERGTSTGKPVLERWTEMGSLGLGARRTLHTQRPGVPLRQSHPQNPTGQGQHTRLGEVADGSPQPGT